MSVMGIQRYACGVLQDPWLVMHKIDSPTKMRYVGNRVAACNASDPSAVPKSIADFVKRPGAEHPGVLMCTSSVQCTADCFGTDC